MKNLDSLIHTLVGRQDFRDIIFEKVNYQRRVASGHKIGRNLFKLLKGKDFFVNIFKAQRSAQSRTNCARSHNCMTTTI